MMLYGVKVDSGKAEEFKTELKGCRLLIQLLVECQQMS